MQLGNHRSTALHSGLYFHHLPPGSTAVCGAEDSKPPCREMTPSRHRKDRHLLSFGYIYLVIWVWISSSPWVHLPVLLNGPGLIPLWRGPWTHEFDSFCIKLNWKVQSRCYGMVLMAPTLTWLKEDILKCILKGWKVLRASCFTDLLLAAIPANVNTGFAVTLLDLGNLLPSFYLCSYRCDFEELWALWSEQVHCVNLGHTSYQPKNIRVIWRGWLIGISPSSMHNAVLKCWNSIRVFF